MKGACMDCRHFHAAVSDADGVPQIGECRARPPVPFMLPLQQAQLDGKTGINVRFPATWPQVPPLAWCSEFTGPKSPTQRETFEQLLALAAGVVGHG